MKLLAGIVGVVASAVLAGFAPAYGKAVLEQGVLRPNIVLIYDSSSSMNNYAGAAGNGRELKSSIAKTALRQLMGKIQKQDETIQVGLIAFGHRVDDARDERVGCKDIESLLPQTPASDLDMPAWSETIEKLRSIGRTPLHAAIDLAIDQMNQNGGQIIMVSDFVESCGGKSVLEICRRLKDYNDQQMKAGRNKVELRSIIVPAKAREKDLSSHQKKDLIPLKNLSQCSGAKYFLAIRSTDVDEITTSVTRTAIRRARPTFLMVTLLNFLDGQIMTDENPYVRVRPLDGTSRNSTDHFVGKPIKLDPGRYEVLVRNEATELHRFDVLSLEHGQQVRIYLTRY